MDNKRNDVLSSKFSDIFLSYSVLLIIGVVVGLIGNAVIIFFYTCRIKDRGERYFITLLALVDLLGCMITPVFYIVTLSSSVVCRIYNFLQICIPGISAHMLLLISIQRYFLVCRPFGPRMTHFWKRVSFGIVCVISLAYSIPLLITSGLYEENFQNSTSKGCRYFMNNTRSRSAYYMSLFAIMLVNIILTAGFYIPVLRRIHMLSHFSANHNEMQQNRNKYPNGKTMQPSVEDYHNDTSFTEQTINASQLNAVQKYKRISNSIPKVRLALADKFHDKKEATVTLHSLADNCESSEKRKKLYRKESTRRRITMMFFSIIVFYVLSYTPPLVILCLDSTNDLDGNSSFETRTRLEYGARIYFGRLVILHHIINPLMYGLFDTKFRKTLCHPCRNK